MLGRFPLWTWPVAAGLGFRGLKGLGGRCGKRSQGIRPVGPSIEGAWWGVSTGHEWPHGPPIIHAIS